MTVKEWLNRGYCLSEKIKALKELRDKQSGKNESYILNEIDSHIAELTAVETEIYSAISKVKNNRLNTLLTERYMLHKSWEAIAEDIDCSDKWVKKKLHPEALKEVAKHIKNDEGI